MRARTRGAGFAGGCSLPDPLLAAERRALVASCAALLDAAGRSEG